MGANCCVTARKTAQQKAKIRQDFRSKSAEWEGTFQGHGFEWAFLFFPWSKEKKQRLSRWLIFTSLATDAGEMWQHWGFQRPRASGMHIITFRFIPAQLTIGITTQLTNTNVKSIHIAMYTEYICTHLSPSRTRASYRSTSHEFSFLCYTQYFYQVKELVLVCTQRSLGFISEEWKGNKFSHVHTHGNVEQNKAPLCQTWLFHERATLSLIHSWTGEDIPEITGWAQQLQGATEEEEGRRAGLQVGCWKP